MTDDPIEKQLREQCWRRKLTVADEAQLRAWLVAHPGAQADWELEAGLSEALGRLPDVPVASNFKARVLRAVEIEAVADARGGRRGWGVWAGWKRWLPRTAIAGALLGAGLASWLEYRAVAHRTQMARSLKAVSDVASLSNPLVMENFDAIRAMSPTPTADEDLLRALQ